MSILLRPQRLLYQTRPGPRVWDWRRTLGTPGLDQARGDIDAYYFDSAQVLQQAAANQSRIDFSSGVGGYLSESASANEIRTSDMAGAVAATNTYPNNWALTAALDPEFEIDEVGEEDGMDFIEVHAIGSPTDGAIRFEGSQQIAALNTETWTHSVFTKLIAGDFTNVTDITLRAQPRDSGGAGAGGSFTTSIKSAFGSDRTRHSNTGTFSDADTAFVRPDLFFTHTGAVDFTFRLYLPQCEEKPFVTSPIKTTSAAVTRDKDILKAASGHRIGKEGAIKIIATCAEGAGAVTQQLLRVDDGTASTNLIDINRQPDRKARFLIEGSNGGSKSADSVATWADGVTATISCAWSVTRGIIQLSLDGATPVETAWTDGFSADVSRMFVGSNHSDGAQLDGLIALIEIYPYAVFGSALQGV